MCAGEPDQFVVDAPSRDAPLEGADDVVLRCPIQWADAGESRRFHEGDPLQEERPLERLVPLWGIHSTSVCASL